MTTTSNSPARMFTAIVVAISLTAAVCANAVGAHAATKKSNRERKTYTSRAFERSDRSGIEPAVDRLGFTPQPSGYHILVDKSQRKMTVFLNAKPIRSYRVYLGFNPEGCKLRRGDGCTPEGAYYICKRNAASAFYRSLLVSYPSPEDALKGLQAGKIDRWTLSTVVSAYQRKSAPPQNTPLGGNICIHGEGIRSRPAKDWTAGCMAVTNEEMTEIFDLIPVGTPLTIRP